MFELGGTSLRVKFSDLPAQYRSVKERVDRDFQEILDSGSFIGGPFVDRFEKEFASFTGSSHCIAVGNGTDALEIILESALSPGSRVGVPANSFIATAEAVSRAGHSLYLLDVDESYNISFESARDAIEQGDLDAVVIVHLFGRPVDQRVIDLLMKSGTLIFEDCAQAHGAQVGGRSVGSIGVASAFSFFPGKNLGAFGDAGGICTSDSTLDQKLRRVRNHGRLSKFDHEIVGRNSRMDAIQAAVLAAKLELLPQWNDARRRNADIYKATLAGIEGLKIPVAGENGLESVFHHFVVRTDRRDALRDHLSQKGIETGIHYPDAISQTSAYSGKYLGPRPIFAEKFSREILSLPVAEHLEERQINFVAESIREFMNLRGGRE